MGRVNPIGKDMTAAIKHPQSEMLLCGGNAVEMLTAIELSKCEGICN